jgi:hypothetical protein
MTLFAILTLAAVIIALVISLLVELALSAKDRTDDDD